MPRITYSKAPREYPPSELYTLRRKLKTEIYHRRRIPGGQPMCPICGMGITIEGGGDLHEVFFTRGDVQGVRDEESHHMIFHPCNVVLIHHGQCHLTAQHTLEGKRKCALQIIAFEGAVQVRGYINSMACIFNNWLLAQEQLNLVLEITPNDETEPRVFCASGGPMSP